MPLLTSSTKHIPVPHTAGTHAMPPPCPIAHVFPDGADGPRAAEPVRPLVSMRVGLAACTCSCRLLPWQRLLSMPKSMGEGEEHAQYGGYMVLVPMR